MAHKQESTNPGSPEPRFFTTTDAAEVEQTRNRRRSVSSSSSGTLAPTPPPGEVDDTTTTTDKLLSDLLTNEPKPTTHRSSPSAMTFSLPKPERPRTYAPTPDNFDAEGEEAEREFAAFGGDVPLDQVKIGRRLSTRRPSLGGGRGGRQRSRSLGAAAEPFPELSHVDSAFSEAHREMERVYSRRVAVSGDANVAEVDENKVDWVENDPDNPQNWSLRRKWLICGLCSLLTVNVTFASSAPSSTTAAVAAEFGASSEVAVLTTSMFLTGYVIGPLLWAPISEMVGRRPVFIVTMFIYMLFQLTGSLAKNIQTIVVGRLLAGLWASAPLTNCGGVVADTFNMQWRGAAMSVFTASVFLGPVMGPIVGAFVTSSFLGWRWVFWIMMIFAAFCWVLVVIFLPETYAPVLLAKRAKKLRKEDPKKNKELYADLERADFSMKSILTRTLARPFIMLAVEPILILVTLYLSIVYGLLYGLFSVFPVVFEQKRGFNPGESGLMFIGVGIGTTLGAALNVYVQRHYWVLVPKWHGHPPPEERLRGAMLSGPFLLIGIFMLGWTGNYPSVHWIVPEIAAIFLGMSFTLVFISFLSYLIETYLMFAASALASNTIVRSAVAAAFPLFTRQMFARLGVNWACTLLGGIMILVFPSPYLFFKYGARIRDGSRFAPCLDIHMRDRVEREEMEAREKADRQQMA